MGKNFQKKYFGDLAMKTLKISWKKTLVILEKLGYIEFHAVRQFYWTFIAKVNNIKC